MCRELLTTCDRYQRAMETESREENVFPSKRPDAIIEADGEVGEKHFHHPFGIGNGKVLPSRFYFDEFVF